MIQYMEFLDGASFVMFAFILYLLSSMSKRLGEVMGLEKYYYLYYLSIFIILTSVILILPYGLIENGKLYGYAFFSIGMTLSLITSIKYWGWLIKELFRG